MRKLSKCKAHAREEHGAVKTVGIDITSFVVKAIKITGPIEADISVEPVGQTELKGAVFVVAG